MPLESTLFTDIVIALAAALAGALVAHVLRLPLLLGYLAAGIVVGPHISGIVTTTEEVRELAEFGVVLLLFAVGVEISIKDLRSIGKPVIAIGIGQIALSVGAGFGVGAALGWDWEQAFLLGLIASLSSTMVVLKVLVDRDELRSLHGRLLTGLMLIQDLAFVAMVAVVPALGEGGDFSLAELGEGMLKAIGALAVMVVIGPMLFPRVLRRMAIFGQRELFLLSLVAITFLVAAITEQIGLSAAVGAFLAGLALSESDLGHRALSETVSLRSVFGALFFVSLGMLADPGSVIDDPTTLAAIVGLVVFAKFVISAGMTRAAGYMPYVAAMVGFGAVQIGEFSFVLADHAARLHIVDEEFLSVVVMAAVITMAITPASFALGSRALDASGRVFAGMRPYDPGSPETRSPLAGVRDHAIVAGIGRVGSMVAFSLHERGIPVVAIDMDPRSAARLRGAEVNTVIGSSSSVEVLDAARAQRARLLVVATGDGASASLTAERAREVNPRLDIVVRAHWRDEIEHLTELGVDEIVWPENEAGLEIVRHSLLRFHTEIAEAEEIVSELRVEATTQESGPDDFMEVDTTSTDRGASEATERPQT